jgi:hypothetical protein
MVKILFVTARIGRHDKFLPWTGPRAGRVEEWHSFMLAELHHLVARLRAAIQIFCEKYFSRLSRCRPFYKTKLSAWMVSHIYATKKCEIFFGKKNLVLTVKFATFGK